MPDDSGRPDLTELAEERAHERFEHEHTGESEPPPIVPIRGLHYQDEAGMHYLGGGLADAPDGTMLVKTTVDGEPALVFEDPVEVGGIPSSEIDAASGVAKLGTDKKVGGPGGSALSPSVVNGITNPANVGYDVVLLTGQSNMVGYGAGGIEPVYFDYGDPRISQYAGSGIYFDQLIAAIDPLFHHEQKAGCIGHAMTFAKQLLPVRPTNRRVLLVPCAHGSTGFTTSSEPSPPAGYTFAAGGSWDTTGGAKGINLYEFAIAQANQAIALNPNNKLVAILWLQGEADAANAVSQATYAADLDALIAGFRANITGAATVPFVLGQMLPERIAALSAYQTINLAHIDTPRRNTKCAFYYGPTGYGDPAVSPPLHYESEGQRRLGVKAYEALALAEANVKGTPPAMPVGVTLSQSGTTVNVSWTRTVGRVTDYKVESSPNGTTGWAPVTRSSPNVDITAAVTGLTLGATVYVRVATVNEEGQSAFTAPVSLTLVTLPGKVTELATGAQTASTVPLTWHAAERATSYLVEWKLKSASEWTNSESVATNKATVGGLKASSAYEFRVTAVNAAGNGETPAAVSSTTNVLEALLTAVGVAALRAYGLRKLNSAYAGKCIKVRRSSDNTTTEIGFTGNELNTEALLTFVGAGNGFIETFYDQSGNGYNLTQATTGDQAQIVKEGKLITQNSLPSCVFDGAAVKYEDSTAGHALLWSSGQASSLLVANPTAGITGTLVVEGGTSVNTLYGLTQSISPNGQQRVVYRDDANNTFLTQFGSQSDAGALHAMYAVDTGTQVTFTSDGKTVGTFPYSREGHTLTTNKFALGAFFTSSFWAGSLCEIVLFTKALTPEQLEAAHANQVGYWGVT
jgi:hypothetical protein